MKKLIYILLALSIVFTSCIEELGPDKNYIEEGFLLTINNSPLTKATNSGTDYERKIETLDCFFYPKGETGSPCVYYHREVLQNTYGQAVVPIYVVEDAISKIFPTENTCEIFVIANLPESVKPEGVTFDADPNNNNTTVDALSELVLTMAGRENSSSESEYDEIGEPFVMAGLATGQKDSKKNASGTINLRRAASKVTISVAIPEYIKIKDKQDIEVRMLPQCEDDQGRNTLKAAFHNGTYKGYLYKGAAANADEFLFSTEKATFTYKKTLDPIKYKNDPTRDSIPSRRVYTCEVPFYTYARTWAKGDADAAYMTFEMPWGYDKGNGQGVVYDTYYYQILINGPGLSFQPNNWYDMTVNIGVIGSSIENIPVVMDHLMFYILDWTDQDAEVDHPEDEVTLDMYKYLIVNESLLELDNVDYGNITFTASHQIAWDVTSAYYIKNNDITPTQETLTITDENFINDRTGVLTYFYNIPSNVYSPIYVDVDIWLDFDGDNELDDNEKEYLESVSIIQYPMMYVIRDESSLRSVYINGIQHDGTNMGNAKIGPNNKYGLGSADGVRNYTSDNITINQTKIPNYRFSYSMFIINVSSFNGDDNTFTAPVLNNDGYLSVPTTGTGDNGGTIEGNLDIREYEYIIGDPRQRTNVMDLTTGPWSEVKSDWAKDYNQKTLQYYYPTDGEGNTFQIVAPKFRIVSFNNASGKNCDPYGAAMRCASLQEDGIPAGRWRLPTVAEIKYIIKLQQAGAIQAIFTSGSSYYTTAAFGDKNHSKLITLTLDGNNFNWNNLTSGMSVRCVYDEWYWGDTRKGEREAVENSSPSKQSTNGNNYRTDYLGNPIYFDEYFFTWGDREIIW